MPLKLKSLKFKEDESGAVTVNTQGGSTITASIPEKSLHDILETLAVDVTRDIKAELRKELKQLELRDESKR